MSKKDNLPRGVQLEFEDIDYWRKLPKNKFVTLPDGSRISIYNYMKKFMHEAYANNFSRSEPESNILQTEESKKWARRNNNNTNRDILLIGQKSNTLKMFGTGDTLVIPAEGQEEGWENTFKNKPYKECLDEILQLCCEDLEIVYNDSSAKALMAVYSRISRFLRLVKKDQKLQKEQK